MKTLDTVGTRRHQGAKAKAQQATDGDSIEPAAEPKAAEASGWDSTDGTNAKHNPGGEGSDSKSWWGSEYGNETEHKKLNTMELRTRGLMPLRSQKMSPGM